MTSTETDALRKDADVLYGEKKFADAMAKYQQIILINPKDVNAIAGVAACLQGQGYVADAKKWYESALKIDPDHKYSKDNLQLLSPNPQIESNRQAKDNFHTVRPDQQGKATVAETKVNALVCPYCNTQVIIKADKTIGLIITGIGILLTCVFIGIPIWIIGMFFMINPKYVYFCPRCKRNVQI